MSSQVGYYQGGDDGSWIMWVIGLILMGTIIAIAMINSSGLTCSFGVAQTCSNPATVIMQSPSGKATAPYCDEHSAVMYEYGWRIYSEVP